MASVSERLSVFRGDISALDVDVIVNAANSALVPGGGVDGAINKAAGPELGKAMKALGGCPTGEARITAGFRLKARHVVHTVAPIFAHHKPDDVWRLLGLCYANALLLSEAVTARRVAFPCLGTGVYAIPVAEACKVAIAGVLAHLETHALPEAVVFCCFDETNERLYRTELARLSG